MRNFTKSTVLTSCLAFLSVAGSAPMASADQWDKKTVMTINEPIQVPNKVLEPGTYVFKILDSNSDRHVVQIFSKDGMHLITTILAIPNYKLKPSGKTDFGFWETPAGQPQALRAWFYPGDNFGQEFAYSAAMSTQISANNSNVTVPVEPASVAVTPEPKPAVEAVVTPAPEPAPAPAPEPQTTAAVTPPPAPEPVHEQAAPTTPEPRELPHTASPYPLVMLVGLLSLGVFGVLSLRSKRVL